jgi:hypothetical protein
LRNGGANGGVPRASIIFVIAPMPRWRATSA